MATYKYISYDNWLYIYQKLKSKFTSIETSVSNNTTALNSKVDKVTGKGLSTNDLTDELVAKINAAATGNFATEEYVDTAVSNLVNSAPEALDTLNELAAALGNDASFSATVTSSLAEKVNTSDLVELTNEEIDEIMV